MADFIKIDNCLSELLRDIRNFEQGKGLVKLIIDNNFEGFCGTMLDEFDLNTSYHQFETWLTELLKNEPMPSEIRAVYLGIFESVNSNSEHGVQLYISGSSEWSKEDSDWACNTDYFPEGRYPEIKIFCDLLNLMECYEDVAFFLYLSIPVLFIYGFASNYTGVLLGSKKELNIATGFDDGDLYNIGKLTLSGVEKI